MPRYDNWEKQENLHRLEQSNLFRDCLLPDIQKGVVFPAIRGGKIDFYHVGRKLFSFTNRGFRSNIAYVVACQNKPDGEVAESDIRNLKLCSSFLDGYKQIQHNTTLYAEPESEQVAHIWNKHSYCITGSGPIVVLDIELSLNAKDEGKSDRIDLILLNINTLQLHFFEVKTFRNRELRSVDGQVPVVAQIERYNGQIERRSAELLAMYQQYVGIVNRLFGTTLPKPQSLWPKVDLLVCAFKTAEGKELKENIIPHFSAHLVCRSIGEARNATQKTLQSWWGKPPK